MDCFECFLLSILIGFCTPEKLVQVLTVLCVLLGSQDKKVCRGLVERNVNVILDMKQQYEWKYFNYKRMCGTIVEGEKCWDTGPKGVAQVEWEVRVPYGEKENREPRPSVQSTSSGEMSIIQITDIHYDPDYRVGSTADCDEPLCCRRDQGIGRSLAETATRFGHYDHCDVPIDLVHSVLQHVVKHHKNIGMIYMTGDLIDHAIWTTSQTKTLHIMQQIAQIFRKYLGNIPVLPVVGNHDTHPVNIFAPISLGANYSSLWAYQGFIDSWGWSLPESAKQTFLKGGYYTFLKEKHFRIIVINSNLYQSLNWWNILYPEDPNDQLAWLATTLLEAEKNQEKVHILSHIPPGSEDTMQVYQREYRKIIDRFEHIITAEFNGHTHYEEFTVFYDKTNSSRATNVAYNGGSITTYYNVNPNYRVYKVDRGTWEVVDFDSYALNISALSPYSYYPSDWEKLYSFKEEYGLSSLAPEEIDKFVIRMIFDQTLFDKYFYNRFKGSNKETYDLKRKTQMLCNMVTSERNDKTKCDQIKEMMRARKSGGLGSLLRKGFGWIHGVAKWIVWGPSSRFLREGGFDEDVDFDNNYGDYEWESFGDYGAYIY